jgi:hypothetical protein
MPQQATMPQQGAAPQHVLAPQHPAAPPRRSDGVLGGSALSLHVPAGSLVALVLAQAALLAVAIGVIVVARRRREA